MKKKTNSGHLVDVVNEWIDEDESHNDCFCVFANKNENGEEVLSRIINGKQRIVSAIINSMESSETAREIIMMAAKAFVYRKYRAMQKDKDITLN